MKLKTFCYFVREAFHALVRNSLMSLTAVGIIVVALIILGVFYILHVNLGQYLIMARDVVDIKVFIQGELEPEQLVQLQENIYHLDGVEKGEYISKEQGRKFLAKALKIPESDLFSEGNPLPDQFRLKLKDNVDLDRLVMQIKVMPGVDEVYAASTVKMMLLILQIIWAVGAGILVIIFFASVYIMINTIRLTVLVRRKEIEIMKLVGATNWFIRWPFLIEGLVLGIMGALIAALLLSKGYHSMAEKIHSMARYVTLAGENQINLGLVIWLFSTGILIGLAGSLFSLKKFLKV
ncbi:MAG: permease-like cell division protein FtsX [Bacillota bacterium]